MLATPALLPLFFNPSPDPHWLLTRDGDSAAFRLYLRHYSARHYADGRVRKSLFAGVGEKTVLITPDEDAVFVWRRQFIPSDGQAGVCCSLFRNESQFLSSLLIEEACQIAWRRWGAVRLFTYVKPDAIRSTNPGYCFKRAGFRYCGLNKSGRLHLLERHPE